MESILVRPFPHGPKGRFDQLPARNLITITANTPHEPFLRIRPQASSCGQVWVQLSRPCALGIITLAIAVALWGFGYKLSLYHRHAAPLAHASVAKLWIDPNGAYVGGPSRLKAKSHPLSGSQAFPCPVPRFHRLNSAAASTLPLCERRVAFFHLLIPSRAPPPLRFRLA
jgi:hypothetical protein